MELIWAPWRGEYIKKPASAECFLCSPSEYLVFRGQHCFVILNKFPYNPGHLMIAPYRHITQLEQLTQQEALELMALTQRSIRALKSLAVPHGFNIGINIGPEAGAGMEHLHQHVVPRWRGDTNFMPVLASIKVLPEHLDRIHQQLERIFQEV